jgi:hypothetical protein
MRPGHWALVAAFVLSLLVGHAVARIDDVGDLRRWLEAIWFLGSLGWFIVATFVLREVSRDQQADR